MMGEITAGHCLREWELWYGDKPAGPLQKPCPIPLSDGKLCGDTTCGGPRCPYNRKGLKVDMTGQKHVTYAYLNNPTPTPPTEPVASGSRGRGFSVKGRKGKK